MLTCWCAAHLGVGEATHRHPRDAPLANGSAACCGVAGVAIAYLEYEAVIRGRAALPRLI